VVISESLIPVLFQVDNLPKASVYWNLHEHRWITSTTYIDHLYGILIFTFTSEPLTSLLYTIREVFSGRISGHLDNPHQRSSLLWGKL
jgi:hypothetical protein